MNLEETIIYHHNLFIDLYVAIVLLAFWAVKGRFQSNLFKILVSTLLIVVCLWMTIFSVAIYHVIFATSFLNHIQSGDLIAHLKIGFGL
jgi:hypothetical protein